MGIVVNQSEKFYKRRVTSTDYELEAVSHDPSGGEFAALACLLTAMPSNLNKRFLSYSEIPSVAISYLAKLQPCERAWEYRGGKKTLLSLTLI